MKGHVLVTMVLGAVGFSVLPHSEPLPERSATLKTTERAHPRATTEHVPSRPPTRLPAVVAITTARASANWARAARLAALEARVRRETSRVAAVAAVSRQVTTWLACMTYVRVDESGDRHHAWGFRYHERDGTGVDHRTALTIHRGAGPGTWSLLNVSRRSGCASSPVQPGGTAEAARRAPTMPATPARVSSRPPSDRALSQRASALRRSIDRLEARLRVAAGSIDRFDEWESCLVWLPTTENGDLDQDVGFEFDTGDGLRYRPAISIDRTGLDDPDYQLIGFRTSALPFTRGEVNCDRDPGESADRVASALRALRAPPGSPVKRRQWIDRVIRTAGYDLAALREDVDDMQGPVEDFQQFDQCMYTVGVSEFGRLGGPTGYDYVASDGSSSRRPALAFAMRGFELPQLDLAAFPGEEPPQIECNEDAGGEETDE